MAAGEAREKKIAYVLPLDYTVAHDPSQVDGRWSLKGADLLIRSAAESGIKVCFANPGTTELPIVAALDSSPGIRGVLGLFEGVCTGAADGYGRVLDRPAMTLLHLGPGFANGIANLYNAQRAHSPLLNIVGEHATWHRDADPPLAMDIEGLVRTVSGWWRTSKSAQEIGRDVAEAVAATRRGRVATLIVPHDLQLAECGDQDIPAVTPPCEPVRSDAIETIARRVQNLSQDSAPARRKGITKTWPDGGCSYQEGDRL